MVTGVRCTRPLMHGAITAENAASSKCLPLMPDTVPGVTHESDNCAQVIRIQTQTSEH